MDVAVIGGGVVGASIAAHCARDGVDVTVFEQNDACCDETTSRASGGFRQLFASPVNVDLSTYSVKQFRTFTEEWGSDPELAENGYLFLLNGEADVALFERAARMQRSKGVDVERLTPGEIEERWDLLETDDLLAGFYGAGNGLFKPEQVCRGFVEAAEDAGAEIRRGRRVVDIPVTDGTVTGVQTGAGRERFDVVVDAAGPWAPRIASMVDVRLPITPSRREVAVVDASIPDTYPLVSDFGNDVYFRPWNGNVLMGGNREPYDIEEDPDDFHQGVHEDWFAGLREAAGTRSERFQELQKVDGWGCMYAMTPDRKAIIDAPGPDGFVVAAGFSGHGVMHSPATGRAVQELVVSGAVSTFDMDPLRLDRFELFEI